MAYFTSHQMSRCHPGHSCQHLKKEIKKNATTKYMTNGMIHDYWKKSITIENYVKDHFQTH